MPISVPGHDENSSAQGAGHTQQRGFTLLEVLVVLAIIGIVTGTVGLSVGAARDARGLHDDARRLAQLFSIAQAQARQSGRPVVWEYDTTGYRFVQAPRALRLPADLSQAGGAIQRFDDAGPLRSRAWTPERAVQVRLAPPASGVFHDEWVSGPQVVELHDGLSTVHLQRAGDGHYQVLP